MPKAPVSIPVTKFIEDMDESELAQAVRPSVRATVIKFDTIVFTDENPRWSTESR